MTFLKTFARSLMCALAVKRGEVTLTFVKR